MLQFFRLILLTVFVASNSSVQAQTDTLEDVHGADFRVSFSEKRISLVTGYNFWHYHNVEIGAAFNSLSIKGHHPFSWATFLSSEIFIDKNPIIGPKIGGWISGGIGALALGGNLIYYTDFNQGTLHVRPEIGVGVGSIKLTYGYNFPLTNKNFSRLNSHCISAVFLIPLKKYTEFEYTPLR